jgi:Uma2 family endonuclease
MVATKELVKLSWQEYLEAEKTSLVKHEYIQGEVYEMAGASDSHITIALNIALLLKNFLRGSGCRVYISDMKARIESLNIFYYPDIIVTCEPKDEEFTYYKKYPKLIIEVLSDSTESFDRGDKFADYRQIETLEEYVLISQSKKRVECFRKNEENLWVLHTYQENEQLTLTSINFSCEINDLYEDVAPYQKATLK